MSLLDLASLVLAPTATKEGKVYSAIPDTGEGDMTFTRGSSATRVNSAGLIEKERGNLLLQSNTFNTTWAKSGVTLASGQSGYDGTNDAWEVTRSTSAYSRLNQSITQSGVVTHSVYAKAGTLNWVSIGPSGGGEGTWFNLTTGEKGEEGSAIIHSSIQSAGNDWWRISVVINNPFNQFFRLYPANVDGGDDSTTAGTIYIQDAMLNEGLVAQSYIETTTTAVYEGITDDVPRVDYSGGGCPSLLLEPSRTQLLPQSEYANSSDWNNGGTTYENNAATSPEGVDNAIKVSEDTSTAFHYLGSQKTGVSTAGDYAISGFIKKGSRRYAGLRGVTNGFVNRYFVLVDLNDGSVVDTNTFGSGVTWSHNVTEYANGWYRIEITGGHTSGTIDATFGLSDSDSPSYTGGLPVYNGVSGEHIFCYGLQIEAGSYVSSYINSYGTSTTRVQDSCSKTGISELIGQTEGTLFVEFMFNNKGDAGVDASFFAMQNSSGSSYLNIYRLNTTLAFRLFDNGSNQFFHTETPANETLLKVAFAYKQNDFALYINGVQEVLDTSGSVGAMSEIHLAGFSAGDNITDNYQTILFPTRLTNDQLQELTK
jgi:hypothetical protein